MISLLFTIIYILIFELFQLDRSMFMSLGIFMLMGYRIYKGESTNIFGLFLIAVTKYEKQQILGWLACFIFVGYYGLKDNLFVQPHAIITYLGSVIPIYFLCFQEGTKSKYSIDK